MTKPTKWHPPNLIRVFAWRFIGSLGAKLSSSRQRRLWSDWADAQADLSLRWAHRSFLVHLSLQVYWWAYSIAVVRRPSVVVRPSVVQPLSKIFFSKTAWPIKAKFHTEPHWDGGTKVYSRSLGHMAKMAATPIFGKNATKTFFLQNQRANVLVAWYVALGTRAHHSLFKWWH